MLTGKISSIYSWIHSIALVIRQKGESQNGCFKKRKHAQFSEKRIFLTPWYAHVRARIRGKKCSFFRKIWRALFSWNTRFEIRTLALLPAICRNILSRWNLVFLSNLCCFWHEMIRLPDLICSIFYLFKLTDFDTLM